MSLSSHQITQKTERFLLLLSVCLGVKNQTLSPPKNIYKKNPNPIAEQKLPKPKTERKLAKTQEILFLCFYSQKLKAPFQAEERRGMFAAENGLKGDPRLQGISEAIRVVPDFPKPGLVLLNPFCQWSVVYSSLRNFVEYI